MKKLFGSTNISWKFLILFSIIIGLIVGIINRIPLFNNTSMQDIAIYLEMWIILAIFIIVNSKNVVDAILKCFIFFLISQPLIYFTESLIDTIFYNKDFFNIFILYIKNYYFGANWFLWTILTIPGAFIAYQIKKNNILSGIILSVATSYLVCVGINGLINSFLYHFPYHILNAIICLVMAYLLILLIIKNNKSKIIALIITSVCLILSLVYTISISNKPLETMNTFDFEGDVIIKEIVCLDENIATVSLSEDGTYMIVNSSKEIGKTKIIAKDNDNNEYIYIVNSTSKNFTIELQK